MDDPETTTRDPESEATAFSYAEVAGYLSTMRDDLQTVTEGSIARCTNATDRGVGEFHQAQVRAGLNKAIASLHALDRFDPRPT